MHAGPGIFAAAILAAAQPQLAPTPGDMSRSVAPLVERVRDSVVSIQSTKYIQRVEREDPWTQFFRERMGLGGGPKTERQAQQSLGSGFIVDSQGTILTNNHVVAGADEVVVMLGDDRRLEARVVGTDPDSDVAVVKLRHPPRDLRPVSLGDSEKVRVGDYVLAIGNPLGLGQTVTMGIVSAKNRFLAGKIMAYEDFIQTDAAINQGNSGGPLFNFAGQVIGINSAILNPAMAMNVGFAIPINMAQQIADQISRTGKVARGFLGVASADFTPDQARALGVPFQPGALINLVTPGTPAAAAGLLPNDVIVEIGGRHIDGKGRVAQSIAARRPGDRVKVVVMRGRQRIERDVILAENVDLNSGGVSVMGIRVQALSARDAEELGVQTALRVLGVAPRSSASGSLQQDDLIVAIEIPGRGSLPATVSTMHELEKHLARGRSGRLILVRDGEFFGLTLRG